MLWPLAGRKTAKKPRFRPNFQVWGAPVTHSFLDRAKFGMREWTYGVLYHANFTLISILSPVTNFWTLVAPAPTCLTVIMPLKIWHAWVDQQSSLTCRILLVSLNCVVLGRQNPKFGRTFNLNVTWWHIERRQRRSWTGMHDHKPSYPTILKTFFIFQHTGSFLCR